MPETADVHLGASPLHVGRALLLSAITTTAFVAASALLGGLVLVLRPDGAWLGLEVALLDGSVFVDYLLPGLLLLCVGLLHASAAWSLGHRRRKSFLLTGAAGVSLAGFVLIEWSLVGYRPSQTLYLTLALATMVLAMALVPPRA